LNHLKITSEHFYIFSNHGSEEIKYIIFILAALVNNFLLSELNFSESLEHFILKRLSEFDEKYPL
jgi:hypothetical protein